MTNETVTLDRALACPFCGSKELREVTDDGIHFTQCKSCEATGPTGSKYGEDGAIDWNTRAALAEPVPPADEEPAVRLVSYAADMSTCTLSKGDGGGYFYDRVVEEAEPVPPAGGEVEVVGYWYVPKKLPLQGQYIERKNIRDGYFSESFLATFDVTELVDRAPVNRLQAEVRLLKHDVASYLETAAKTCGLLGIDLEAAKTAEGKPSDVLYRHALALQSDLTSANADKEAYAQNAIDLRKRVDALQAELNKAREYIQSLRGVAHTKGGITLDASIDAFLAHRSAPAAKDESHDE